MKKKLLSWLVTCAMLFSMFPATALAVENDGVIGQEDLESSDYYEFDDVLGSGGAPVLLSTETEVSGTITPVYTSTDRFWGEGGGNASASLVVELYEGNTKIATSTLNDIDNIIDGDVYVTWSIPFDGEDSDYWDVEWAEGYPKYDMNPTKGVMVIDEEVVAESAVQFNAPDDLNKVVALAEGNTGGVVAYTSLVDAMGDFNGRKVNVLRDVNEKIEAMKGCTLTTNVEGGVTVTSTYDSWIYCNDLFIGEDVTMKGGNVFYETDGVNTVEGTLVVDETFYHGYDAKTTVQNGGSIAVGGATQLRYNTDPAAGLYIYGDGNDSTVEYKCSYYIAPYSGTFYAEDANIEAGYVLLKNSYDNADYADVAMKLDNSTLKVIGTNDGQNSFIIDDQASLTLKNGSAIADVRDFSILEGTNLSLSVDSTSSISATNVSIADDVPLGFEKNKDGTVSFSYKLSGEGTVENPYVIKTLDDLKGFRDAVNSGNTYQGKTVKLADDIDFIDLTGEEWTPIGTSGSAFKGVFDGNEKTIRNLVITGNNRNVGLFGYTTNGEIKNLTVENAKVSGYLNVGVVAGTPYTSKYTNIKVIGHVEVNGMAYVGGVGGKNAYADWTDITVDVDDTSYVKAVSTEDGTAYRTYVGGVIGFMGEGSHTFKNIKSNIDVIGDVCDVGGITGIAHYGNNFENITCTGDVTNTNSDPDDVLETGLIAGVWHNQAGYDVEFTNINATGTISAPNVTDVEFENGSLIGAAYSTSKDSQSTSGTLIVDSVRKWPLVARVEDEKYADLQSAIAAAADGETVTLLGDVTCSETINIPAAAVVTIDLNGKTLNGSILAPNAELTVQNGSIVNGSFAVSALEINAGKLTLTDVNITSARHAVRIDGAVTATIDGGEYKTVGTANMTTHAVNVSGAANVTIENGTFVGPKGTSADSGAAVKVQSGATVTISNGEFSGGLNDTLSSAGTLKISGGTYDQAVKSDYCADGYVCKDNGGGTYKVVSQYVAQIGTNKYMTFKAALEAVEEGETIVLLNAEGDESNTEIAFDKAFSFTITGNAPNYALPVVTFQNATVNIKDATILIPELDARQNATINVIDSTVYDAGENSIVKSYYNGAINISGDSTVYTMQLTTIGYITLSDSAELTATWQTNVYGNGLITVNESATLNTAALHLTGQDYSDRDNTDADRVGKPAAIVVDGGTLNVGTNCYSSSGADYNYNSSHGINIGTEAGKNALMDIKNGATVTIMQAADKTVAVGAGGTVNVGADMSVTCRGEGDVILTNDGVITLTDATAALTTANGNLDVKSGVDKYITQYADGKYSLTGVSVTGVTLDKTTASVNEGNTTPLSATVVPDNAANISVSWSSSDASVATVDENGVVTGVSAGTATITATTVDGGFTAECVVTVKSAPSGGSSGGGGGGSSTYSVTVEDSKNGDIKVSPSRASSGSTVTITVDPDNGYELDELTVLDKNGKEVKLTKKSDTKYTFKMPSGKVTIEATFAEIADFENPFVDVAENAYYYDAVLWAAENGITGGTSATTFSPANVCTRAQTVTFLWRAAGSPEPATTNMPFTDVAEGSYYYDAVLWAVENGITSGTSATTFSPNATVTRAQNVTFLWRWAESPAAEEASSFADVGADAYYNGAVAWAAEEGITSGTSATTFSPNDPCLRSQIVTFLYRYMVG